LNIDKQVGIMNECVHGTPTDPQCTLNDSNIAVLSQGSRAVLCLCVIDSRLYSPPGISEWSLGADRCFFTTR